LEAFNSTSYFYRMIESTRCRSLSPEAFVVLLYLYRRFAETKQQPVTWSYMESDLDIKTAKRAHAELIQRRFIRTAEFGKYALLNPDTKALLMHPKTGQRFQGIRTFRFPWFVLDYRRLSPSALKLYAYLWDEKANKFYLTDQSLFLRTGLSERTVRNALRELEQNGKIITSIYPRAAFARRPQTKRIREALADSRVTRVRQIELCDPDYPGQSLRERALCHRRIEFTEFRDGDVLALLNELGVPVLRCDGRTIVCAIPSHDHRYQRHVDSQTGFSKLDTDERNRKGKRRQDTESIWEMAIKYKGDDGPKIVEHWYRNLTRRNVVADPRIDQIPADFNSGRVPPSQVTVVGEISL
jgi:hypothetical protein